MDLKFHAVQIPDLIKKSDIFQLCNYTTCKSDVSFPLSRTVHNVGKLSSAALVMHSKTVQSVDQMGNFLYINKAIYIKCLQHHKFLEKLNSIEAASINSTFNIIIGNLKHRIDYKISLFIKLLLCTVL